MTYTESDILAYGRVPVPVAAAYLHMGNRKLYAALRQGVCPFGYAVEVDGAWHYTIPSERFLSYVKGADLRMGAPA